MLGASTGVLIAVRQARLRYHSLNISWKFTSYLVRVDSVVAPLSWDMEYGYIADGRYLRHRGICICTSVIIFYLVNLLLCSHLFALLLNCLHVRTACHSASICMTTCTACGWIIWAFDARIAGNVDLQSNHYATLTLFQSPLTPYCHIHLSTP